MIVYGYVSKFFMAPKNDQVPKMNRAHTDFWDTAILTKHSSFTPFIHPLPLEDSNNGPLLSKSCCHHWHLKDQLSHKRQQIWWSREIVYDVYNWYIHIYSLYMRDRQNEKAWKWTIVGGFAFGVPASLCKAFDNFVYHSCTVPIGNQDIHRNPKCGFVKSGMHFFSQTHVEDFNAMCGVFVEDALPAIWKIYLGVVHLNDMSIRPGPW